MENAIEYGDGTSGIEVRAATLDDVCVEKDSKILHF